MRAVLPLLTLNTSDGIYATSSSYFGGPVYIQNASDSTAAFSVSDASGASVVSVDTTNGRLGIGISAPTVGLDVRKSVLFRGASSVLFSVADNNGNGVITVDTTTGNSVVNVGRTGANSAVNLNGLIIAKPTTGNDSSSAFQVQTAGGTTILGVDTSGSQVLFGKPSTASAKLVLYNSSNNNTITITTAATTANTTIKLPGAMPAASTQQGSSYLPLIATLTADSAASTTTTLADIIASGNANDALSLTIPANTTVNFRVSLIYVGTATNTGKWGWKCSNTSQSSLATAWMTSTATVVAAGGSTTACGTTAAAVLTGGGTGVVTPQFAEITGTIKANAGAATTVNFEYADVTSGQATTVKAGSYVQWWQ
jgi:hypothetical protein